MQRIAHELWDYAESRNKRQLGASDVQSVTDSLVAGQSTYYELLSEQLSPALRGIGVTPEGINICLQLN